MKYKFLATLLLVLCTILVSQSLKAQINRNILGVKLGTTTREGFESIYPGVDQSSYGSYSLNNIEFAGVTWDTVMFGVKDNVINSITLVYFSANYDALFKALSAAFTSKYKAYEKQLLHPEVKFYFDKITYIFMHTIEGFCYVTYVIEDYEGKTMYQELVEAGIVGRKGINVNEL